MHAPTECLAKDGRKVLIREATKADLSPILGLWESVGAEGRFILTEHVSDSQRNWMAGSMDSPTPILNEVAEIEGSVVGHLSLEPRGRGQSKKSEHVAGLGMLILKGYRGIGIGTAMMEYAIKWAKDKGFEKISLSAFSTNEPAINLYKKFRFEVEGIKKKEFKIDGEYVDEVCMGLLLR